MFPFRLSNFFSPLHFLTNFLENIPLLFSKKKCSKTSDVTILCNYDADIRQRKEKFRNSEKRLRT